MFRHNKMAELLNEPRISTAIGSKVKVSDKTAYSTGLLEAAHSAAETGEITAVNVWSRHRGDRCHNPNFDLGCDRGPRYQRHTIWAFAILPDSPQGSNCRHHCVTNGAVNDVVQHMMSNRSAWSLFINVNIIVIQRSYHQHRHRHQTNFKNDPHKKQRIEFVPKNNYRLITNYAFSCQRCSYFVRLLVQLL